LAKNALEALPGENDWREGGQ